MEAFEAWWRACPPDVRRQQGFEYLTINRGCAVSLPGMPSAVFNRVFGLSDVDELEEACRWMNSRTGPKFLQLDLETATDKVKRWIAAKGLVERGSPWAKLVCVAPSASAPQPSAAICRRVDQNTAQLFGSLICQGFGLPETLIPIWASIIRQNDWSCFLAFEGDRPIGTGAMYSSGGCSWLGAGMVLPQFRGRGVHKALIEARIRESQTRGISKFVAEATFSASTPVNTSYENLKTFGLERAYTRMTFTF